MPTFSHPCVSDHSHAFRSAFVAWGLPIFEHSPAHASLRHFGAKELALAEGNPISHL
jgi:hypothetical protein